MKDALKPSEGECSMRKAYDQIHQNDFTSALEFNLPKPEDLLRKKGVIFSSDYEDNRIKNEGSK